MTENRAKNMRILTTVLRGACTASLDAPKYRRSPIFPGRQMPAPKTKELQGEYPASLWGVSCRSHRRGLCGFLQEAAHVTHGGRDSCGTAWGALDLTPSNKLN